MLAFGFGVETGVDEKLGWRTPVLIGEAGVVRVRSGMVLTVTMVRSRDAGRILFCCSARLAQAVEEYESELRII
jgi:hypothetical protein